MKETCVAVEPRCDLLVEVALILHDPCDHERHPRGDGDVDRLRGALVRMDPAEEEQVAAGRRMQRERGGVDPVMDRRQVIEARMPVRIADRNIGGRRVVPLVHGQDPRRREAVDRREHRRLDEPAVGEREKIEAVVDDVELVRPLEGVRDVQALGHLRVDVRIFGVTTGDDSSEPSGVTESPLANNVTSTPLAASPSVRSEANCSQGP